MQLRLRHGCLLASRPPAHATACAIRHTKLRAPPRLFRGSDTWLQQHRNPATDELKCYLCHGPAAMTADRPARAGRAVLPGRPAALRPGRLRGRSWQGWPRHARYAGPLLRGAGDAAAPLKTVRPDRTPNLPARGRGPVPASHPGRPRHHGLPPGAQRGHPTRPRPPPPKVLRVPVPAPSSFVALLAFSVWFYIALRPDPHQHSVVVQGQRAVPVAVGVSPYQSALTVVHQSNLL